MRWIVLGLAVARATRFVTQDWLGEWTIRAPARRWAEQTVNQELITRIERGDYTDEQLMNIDKMTQAEKLSVAAIDEAFADKRARLVKGLTCPFCVGFWITLAAVSLELAIPHSPRTRSGQALRGAWKVGKAAFAMNYVTAHLHNKIDV